MARPWGDIPWPEECGPDEHEWGQVKLIAGHHVVEECDICHVMGIRTAG